MSYNPVLDLPKSQMYRDMTALGIYDLDNGTLVRCEMRACQYGFQLLRELLDRLEQDWWPLSCSQERLEEWEGLLGIPPRPEASPEARRKGVLALLALGEPAYAAAIGEAPAALTWGNFLLVNLLPVTLGNLLGGMALAAGYWGAYLKK